MVDQARLIYARFYAGIDVSNLNTAIFLYQQYMDSVNPGPSPHTLRQLANAHLIRFNRAGDEHDIEEAITLMRVLHATEPDNISCLCAALLSGPNPDNVSEAVIAIGDSLELDAKLLVDGADLVEAYENSGRNSDVDIAISYLDTAVLNLTWGHSNYTSLVDSLGTALQIRFEGRGDTADLNRAIELHNNSAGAAINQDPGQSLNHLANALIMRFELKGTQADLDSAIRLYYDAVDLRPLPHPQHAQALGSLAGGLYRRFEERYDPVDLDRAIALLREAMGLSTMLQSRDYHALLGNLGRMLCLLFQNRGRVEDLDDGIELVEQTLSMDLLPTDRSQSLTDLARALQARFNLNGEPADLDRAVGLYRDGLDGLPLSHINRNLLSISLADALRLRFEKQRQPDVLDLDMAIEILREVLALLPAPHPHRAFALSVISVAFLDKYENSPDTCIMEEIANARREESTYISSPISERFKTAVLWARTAEMKGHDSALEAFQISIELLPQLAMLGLDLKSRHKALVNALTTSELTVGLPSDAAACAARLNCNEKAVELLEAGRAVFWSQALQLDTSLNDLQVADSALAQRVLNIAKDLELGSHRDVSSMRMLPPQLKEHATLHKEDVHYRELNSAWVRTLHEVREVPGFEGFLLPKTWMELKRAGIKGPVVILNAPRYSQSQGCNAFILTPSGDVQKIHLKQMSRTMAGFMAEGFRAVLSGSPSKINQLFARSEAREDAILLFGNTLRLLGKCEAAGKVDLESFLMGLLQELWERVVEPIFQALELKARNSTGYIIPN
jgi:tetratricopeptide (TPR) repeat protein